MCSSSVGEGTACGRTAWGDGLGIWLDARAEVQAAEARELAREEDIVHDRVRREERPLAIRTRIIVSRKSAWPKKKINSELAPFVH